MRCYVSMAAVLAFVMFGALPGRPLEARPGPLRILPRYASHSHMLEFDQTGLLTAINSSRAQYGVAPLADDASLHSVAEYRSQDQVARHYFSHVTPDGSTIFNLLDAAGIPWTAAGENLAESRGYDPAQAAIEGFMQSPEHRANVLNPSFTQAGIGEAQTSDGTTVLTVVFTG